MARIALLIALTLLLALISSLVGAYVPMAVLAVLALIIAMPLSVFVFPRLQANANAAMARWAANRKAHKEYVRAELADREED
nr:DUF4229 domain-containing protein [Corynebacterium sp. TAE3-ERU12]